MKRALITGVTGQDGSYLAELLLAEGVRGLRGRPPLELLQHGAPRRHLPGSARRRLPAAARVRRSRRRQLAQPRAADGQARRDLQPRRAEPRARQLRRPRVHRLDRRRSGRCGCSRRSASRASTRSLRFYQASSSEMFGGGRAAAERDDAVPAAQPLRLRQGVRAPALPELPRGLRDVHLVRHPVQPRVAPARHPVRDPQDHARGGPHPATASRRSSTSATSTPSATGASPATTSRRCG